MKKSEREVLEEQSKMLGDLLFDCEKYLEELTQVKSELSDIMAIIITMQQKRLKKLHAKFKSLLI